MSARDLHDIEGGVSSLLIAGEEMCHVGDRHEFVPPPDPGHVIVKLVQDGDGGKSVVAADDIMSAIDARAASPRDRRGSVRLSEVDSLIAYINRYKSTNTIAWANVEGFAFAIVLDDHPAGAPSAGAAWRNHRASYACPRSPEWQAWCALDGKWQTQEAFADFIESRLEDLRALDGYPKPLDMLSMARNLLVRTAGTFQRSINPTTGDGILVNKTETTAESTQIPRAFLIGIPVFENGTPYQVEARVRFGLVEGRANFAYTLHRRKEIERDAFGDVRTKIATETGALMLAGTP